ncbi:MAG: glycosyltransferase family 39 protein [Elusimicrobia bacterium]|nr:glycosyltransferase family 39 protein [Elusimicrobiota bacterium]
MVLSSDSLESAAGRYEPVAALGCAFLLALALRLVIPLHIAANSGADDLRVYSSLAAGRTPYEVSFVTSLLYQVAAGAGLLRPTPHQPYSPYWSVPLLQGVADAFGVLLAFMTVSLLSTRKHALWGAFIYALWLPSIFYAAQPLTEGGLPIVLLALSFCLAKAFAARRRLPWLLAAGASTGAVLFIRLDNGLIAVFLPAFIAWTLRRDKAESLRGALAFLGGTAAFCVMFFLLLAPFTGYSHSVALRSSRNATAPSLALALYNALGEYPATYPGLRFYKDEPAFEHMTAKAAALRASEDRSFALLSKALPNDPHLAAYATEVIVGHPARYAGWLALRFLRFLPAHRFFAATATFLTRPAETPAMSAMYGRWFLEGRPVSNSQFGYRSSNVYQTLKYLDLALFALFALGAAALRRSPAARSLACVYLAVLVGHVFTSCGEVQFINNAPWEFLEPRYLIGMVSLWPLFLPAGFSSLRGALRP